MPLDCKRIRSPLLLCSFLSKLRSKYMRQCIQEWTKQNLRKTAFKKVEVIWSAQQTILLQIFKRVSFTSLTCPFLNALIHMQLLYFFWLVYPLPSFPQVFCKIKHGVYNLSKNMNVAGKSISVNQVFWQFRRF